MLTALLSSKPWILCLFKAAFVCALVNNQTQTLYLPQTNQWQWDYNGSNDMLSKQERKPHDLSWVNNWRGRRCRKEWSHAWIFKFISARFNCLGTQLLRRHGSAVLKNMLGESLRLCCRGAAKDAAKTVLKQNSQFITRIVIVGVGKKKTKNGRESCGPITFSCRASHPIVFLITALPFCPEALEECH